MGSEELEMLLGFLKVLADESRMKLMGLLAQGEHSVKELAKALALKEPTVSHHLAKLYDQGIVTMRAEGTTHFYSLNRKVLQRFKRDLFSVQQVQSVVKSVEGDTFERKVMSTYVEGSRLLQIPTMRKKRDVILRWLAQDFEEGVEYSHREVNAIIKKHHPDSATLRRELIGSRLMARERDTYWRISG